MPSFIEKPLISQLKLRCSYCFTAFWVICTIFILNRTRILRTNVFFDIATIRNYIFIVFFFLLVITISTLIHKLI